MNVDIGNTVRTNLTYLEFQQAQSKQKIIPYEITVGRELGGTDLFSINDSNFLCMAAYHSKFPIVKGMEKPN